MWIKWIKRIQWTGCNFSREDSRGSVAGPTPGKEQRASTPAHAIAGQSMGTLMRKPGLDNPVKGWLGFGYVADISIDQFGEIDKTLDIQLQWHDLAGNSSGVVLPETIHADFVRPLATSCRDY